MHSITQALFLLAFWSLQSDSPSLSEPNLIVYGSSPVVIVMEGSLMFGGDMFIIEIIVASIALFESSIGAARLLGLFAAANFSLTTENRHDDQNHHDDDQFSCRILPFALFESSTSRSFLGRACLLQSWGRSWMFPFCGWS